MSFPKPKTALTVAKGRVKCFKCRVVTMAKDGVWHQSEQEMFFLCRACGNATESSKSAVKAIPGVVR